MFASFCATFFVLSANAQVEEVDVIIMGAGMTGISAGNVLNAAEMDNFIILEAQDYIGGRTRTIPFGSKATPVNIGASWISGACYQAIPPRSCYYDEHEPIGVNPMLTLALQYDMQFARTDIHEWATIPPYMSPDSLFKYVPEALVAAEYEHWDAALLCTWPLIEAINAGLMDDMSYNEGLNRCFWGRNPLNDIQKTIQWNEFGLESAANINSTSLVNSESGSYYMYGNQDLLITDPRGYQGITLGLAADYLDLDDLDNEPKIRLNSPITEIVYGDDGVTVSIEGSGRQYHAKYGLVTFSIGVLKSDLVSFSPPLPDWKTEVINKNRMANYSAVYIEWPYDFWTATHPELNEGNIGVMVDDRYGYFPWFVNLNHPSLMPGSFMWRFDISEALAVRFQTMTEQQVVSELINSKFSHYFDIEDIPVPLAVFVGNMTVNKYIQGAYCALPTGYDWNEENPKLGWNVDEVLYFGGEASSEMSGYVHGAYFEGIKDANMILNCLGYEDTDGYECQGPYSPTNHSAY